MNPALQVDKYNAHTMFHLYTCVVTFDNTLILQVVARSIEYKVLPMYKYLMNIVTHVQSFRLWTDQLQSEPSNQRQMPIPG
mmetsp:Transcript_40759/g.49444  ORF Transcript_40759/g.49444 Transcript_40759/m.49444 type:complete len:81 (+) Transcript_40759:71-313(+)